MDVRADRGWVDVSGLRLPVRGCLSMLATRNDSSCFAKSLAAMRKSHLLIIDEACPEAVDVDSFGKSSKITGLMCDSR